MNTQMQKSNLKKATRSFASGKLDNLWEYPRVETPGKIWRRGIGGGGGPRVEGYHFCMLRMALGWFF